MTLREWLDSYALQHASACAWRKRAWRALRPVVEQIEANPRQWSATKALRALDAAGEAAEIKPTGERWIQEREKLDEILQDDRRLWRSVTDDDRGVCDVALDLVELERYDEALALLVEQVPHVLDRPCGACSSMAGWACEEISGETLDADSPQTKALRKAGIKVWSRKSLIVPHASRVAP